MGSTLAAARVARYVAMAMALLLAAAVAVAFAPTLFGREVLVVTSRSMEPWAVVGDVVMTRMVAAEAVGVGDVITFRHDTAATPTTHRVIEVVSRDAGGSTFVTQGDANEDPDPTPVRVVGDVAVAETPIPIVGRVLVGVRTPAVFVALVLLGLATARLERWLVSTRPTRPVPA